MTTLFDIVDAHKFLSGDVGGKLDKTEQAIEFGDTSFKIEKEALGRVIPLHVPISDIEIAIGSTWIPCKYYEEFCLEFFAVRVKFFWSNMVGSWEVVPMDNLENPQNQGQYGFKYAPILKDGLLGEEKIIPAIGKSIEDGIFTSAMHFRLPSCNKEVRELVRAKQDELTRLWSKWLREDERAGELEMAYNLKFNRIVLPNWDDTAPANFRETLRAAGMTGKTKAKTKWVDIVEENGSLVRKEIIVREGVDWVDVLRQYQLDSIWRMVVQGGNGLLGLEVGLGKTICGIAILMLRKHYRTLRTGMIVVQKSTLLQFSATIREAFPTARLLCATPEDCSEKNRQAFLVKARFWDWDCIVLTHESFKLIPVRPETERTFIQHKINICEEELARLEAAGESSRRQGRKRGNRIMKKLEQIRDKLEDRIYELSKIHDKGIRFEDINPDLLIVDEAQKYKNNYYATKMQVKGLNPTQSDRAEDFDLKLAFLRKTRPHKNYLLFMTGTPEPTNSMAGVYTFQQYLQPDALEERGIMHFDSWALNFGRVVTSPAPSMTGGVEMQSRFGEFVNVPELLQMYLDVVHIKRFADVEGQSGFDRPVAKTKIVNSPLSEAQDMAMDRLRFRDACVKSDNPLQFPHVDDDGCLMSNHEDKTKRFRLYHPVTKLPLKDVNEALALNIEFGVKIDNILWVLTDSRKLMVAPQLLDPEVPLDKMDKISLAVRRIFRWWRITKKDKSTQLVFLDWGTPGGSSKFPLYEWMKQQLLDRGVPEQEIAFIQNYKDDEDKENLFKKVNAGDVRILFGSTEPMGIGVNVQAKCKVVHFLDIPRRPDQYEQRLGRAIRSGNENSKVLVYQYLTKGSRSNYGADAAQMKMLQAKIKSREQILAGDTSVRRIVEDDDAMLLFMMFSAHATGDDAQIKLHQISADVEKTQNRSNLLLGEINRLNVSESEGSIKSFERRIKYLAAEIEKVGQDAEHTKSVSMGDTSFSLVAGDTLVTGFDDHPPTDVIPGNYEHCLLPTKVAKAHKVANDMLYQKMNSIAQESLMRGGYVQTPPVKVGEFMEMPIVSMVSCHGDKFNVTCWLQGKEATYGFGFAKTIMVRDIIVAYDDIKRTRSRLQTKYENNLKELAKAKSTLEQKRCDRKEIEMLLADMKREKARLEEHLAGIAD